VLPSSYILYSLLIQTSPTFDFLDILYPTVSTRQRPMRTAQCHSESPSIAPASMKHVAPSCWGEGEDEVEVETLIGYCFLRAGISSSTSSLSNISHLSNRNAAGSSYQLSQTSTSSRTQSSDHSAQMILSPSPAIPIHPDPSSSIPSTLSRTAVHSW